MKITDAPALITTPFAQNGTRNDIPATGDGLGTGRASLATGFPDETMKPITAGGVPPFGADFNGILYVLSNAARFYGAGGHYKFNADFASKIGGYPMGATVQATDNMGHWLNVVEANSTDPESGLSTGWLPLADHNGTATVTLTGNTTLTPLQAAKANLRFTGAPTGNVTVTFPAWTKRYSIINDCTGDQSIICTTGNGESISIKNGAKYEVGCDGNNLTIATVNASQVFAEPNKNVSALDAPTVQQIINALGSAAAHSASDFDPAGTASSAVADRVVRDGITVAGFINGDKNGGAYFRSIDGTIIGITRNDEFDSYIKKASETYISRDGIGVAGFMGGVESGSPYFRALNTGTVVTLAKSVDFDDLKKTLGTASTKNTEDFDPAGAASAAKDEAISNSVVRDSSRRAGFISGNKYAPYIEFKGSDGATEVIELARQAYLGEQLGKLGSMSRQNSDSVNISGGTIKAGEITSTNNGSTYRLINGTDATSYGSFWRMDPYSLHLCLTNAGDSTGGYRDKGIPISVLLSDGTIKLNNSTEVYGGLEIYNGGGTPFIDFHFGGNTGDYTSRIIETASGKLSIYGEMSWTKPRQTLDNLGFDVNKQAKGHQQIGTDGIIIQWGPWTSPARGAGQWVGFDKSFPSGCMGVVVGVANAASQMSGCKNYNNGGFIAATGNEDPLARSGWYIAIGW